MSRQCFNCLGVVLLDVAFIQHRPTHVFARFDGLEPSQFYWVTTYGMHPFDGLFGRWEIVDAVGLLEYFPCLFGWTPRLPLSPLLHQRYLVSSMTISNSDEDGFAFACNEDVFFFEYIVGCLAHTHHELGESWNVSACLD